MFRIHFILFAAPSPQFPLPIPHPPPTNTSSPFPPPYHSKLPFSTPFLIFLINVLHNLLRRPALHRPLHRPAPLHHHLQTHQMLLQTVQEKQSPKIINASQSSSSCYVRAGHRPEYIRPGGCAEVSGTAQERKESGIFDIFEWVSVDVYDRVYNEEQAAGVPESEYAVYGEMIVVCYILIVVMNIGIDIQKRISLSIFMHMRDTIAHSNP